jgi:hypothetical protein
VWRLPGAHTFGRSLTEAKRHGIEVVALRFDLDANQFEIDWNIHLGALKSPVEQARAAIAHAKADRKRRARL